MGSILPTRACHGGHRVGTRLTHAPVILTLCQVVFNDIPDWDVKFQSGLRSAVINAGYPLTWSEQIPAVGLLPAFSEDMAQGLRTQPQIMWRWLARSIDNCTAFVFSSNAVSMMTAAYGDYAGLKRRFGSVLRLVEQFLEPKAVVRTGLRYVNLMKFEGRPASEILASSVHGAADDPGSLGTPTQTHCEAVFQIAGGTLIARTVTRNGEFAIAAELMPLPVTLSEERIAGDLGHYALVDIDHFVQTNDSYEIARVLQRLDTSHDTASMAFESITTEEARTRWL
nr:TIGR04255 family protein [Niveibacterium umoris]